MERRRSVLTGLVPKFAATILVAVVMVAVAGAMLASSRLQQSMRSAFVSKGEAIAIAMVTAAERSVFEDISTLQGTVDANKRIEGVRYIYVEDPFEGAVVVHTFAPAFPEGLEALNPLKVGEVLEDGQGMRVKEIDFEGIRAIDIASPAGGGALGIVHVGMDQDLIDAAVGGMQQRMLFWGALITALGLGLGLLILFWTVILPVRQLTRVTAAIAESGDLTQKIEISSGDEIGELARAFAKMVERLREISLNLHQTVGALTEAVADLSISAIEQNEIVTRQSAALQEAQVTAQEIKQTSMLAAEKAEAVLQVASRAEEIGRSGESAVEQSLAGMTEMRASVEEIATRVRDLGEQTRRVGGITQSVKDLADQSNMLALNAAIEAVRSGEHGKGFAVVAREIRSLADQSIQQTARVRDILESTSEAIAGTVAITEKGTDRMESGLLGMRTSGDNLKQLANIVSENSSAVRQIAAAVSQQNAGIAQIFVAVTELSKMMENAVKRLDATNRSAATLKVVADQVTLIVQAYRV